jgi:hypothetical protein
MWMVNTDHKLHNRFILKIFRVLQSGSGLIYSFNIFHAFFKKCNRVKFWKIFESVFHDVIVQSQLLYIDVSC